jgi:phospholipid/cholesterol/gamma-HCH transport system substrate-binding protein
VSLLAGQERRAELTGGVVLVLLAGAVAFAVFLSGRIHLGRHVRARVNFEHVTGMPEGAPVMVAGRKVGVIEAITLVPAGGVTAWIRIDERRRDMVPVNGDFFIASRGLLGERYIEVGPPQGGAAPGRPIADGDQVVGSSPPSLDRAFQRTFDNLERARVFAAEVGPEARALGAAMGELTATLGELEPGGGWGALSARWTVALAQARASWQALGDAGADPAHVEATAASIAQTTRAAREALAAVRGRAAQVAEGLDRTAGALARGAPSLARLRAALDRFDATAATLDAALAKAQALADAFARGEGTMARIAHDPEFPEDAKELGRILKNQPWRVIGHPADRP